MPHRKKKVLSSNSEEVTSGRVLLYDEYRLIERDEADVNRSWKGAHLLLFFLAFIFGSFCTFCLHMLMYMFDEQCVLFPKLLTLTSEQKKNTRRLLPRDNDQDKGLPVDFVSTQWAEKSVCYLPTFVPLVSSIFGMVWITMFLMCSTGTQTYTGLERPWRILLPVLLFSLAMASLSVYTSVFTHTGLMEFCDKLSEVTESQSCSYAINVVTLAYQRRITGVYQALQMTVVSAWVHTACWVMSAALVLLRVGLAVDFQLVRVKATLVGDVDLMLQRHERQIRTVSPEPWVKGESSVEQPDVTVFYRMDNPPPSLHPRPLRIFDDEDLYPRTVQGYPSEPSLLPEENARIAKVTATKKVAKDKQFIVRMVYDLVESLSLKEPLPFVPSDIDMGPHSESDEHPLRRGLGQEQVTSRVTARRPTIELEAAARKSINRVTKDFISARLLKQLEQLEEERASAAMDTSSTSTLTIKEAISTQTISETKTLTPQPSTSGLKAKNKTEPKMTNTEEPDDMVEMQDRAVQTAPKEPKVTFLEDRTTMTSDDETSQKSEDKVAKKNRKEKLD